MSSTDFTGTKTQLHAVFVDVFEKIKDRARDFHIVYDKETNDFDCIYNDSSVHQGHDEIIWLKSVDTLEIVDQYDNSVADKDFDYETTIEWELDAFILDLPRLCQIDENELSDITIDVV